MVVRRMIGIWQPDTNINFLLKTVVFNVYVLRLRLINFFFLLKVNWCAVVL